jgi:DNA-binding protein H-NS
MMMNEITLELGESAQKQAALKAELAALEQHEKEIKSRLRASAVVQAQTLVDVFEIAPDEMTFTAKRTLKPKYRDPVTGDTWHGFGKRPASLKNVENIDDYLIDPAQKSKKSVTKSTKKSGKKTGGAQAQAAQSNGVQAVALTSVSGDASMRGIRPEPEVMTSDVVHAEHDFDNGYTASALENDAYDNVHFATLYELSPMFGARTQSE